MMFLGGTGDGRNPATAPPNHSNRVTFDESAMVDGIAVYSAVALQHLGITPDRLTPNLGADVLEIGNLRAQMAL